MYIEPNRKKSNKKNSIWQVFVALVLLGAAAYAAYRVIPKSLQIENTPSPVAPAPLPTVVQTPQATIPITTATPPAPTKSATAPTATKPTTAVVTPTNSRYQVGMAIGDLLPWESQAQLNATFDDLNTLGITWVRFDLSWNDIQHDSSSKYNWSGMDKLVATANAHHIKMLPIIGYTPKWARDSACTNSPNCQPSSDAAFATFVSAAAQRYSSKGMVDWEIWNEPNYHFWQPTPSPQAYTDLLKVSYQAIKAVNPSAVVITGGMAPAVDSSTSMAPTDFLNAIYKDGAGHYFDAVGMHPYSFPVTPSQYRAWSGWSQMSQTPVSLRSIMAANGDTNKKIWMTEDGAPTGGPGNLAWVGDTDINSSIDHVTEDLQDQAIIDGIKTASSYDWAGPIFIYSYKDLGTSTSTKENFFGIIRYDGTQKPVYADLKQLLHS